MDMTIGRVLGSDSAASMTSLADLAYERIRDQLITLQIRPGDPINDGQLAADIGVGRTPVREALKRLETDHLVISFPRRGTFATTIDATELGAISEIRRQLAPFAARRAAENATQRMREQMRSEAKRLASGDLLGGDRSDLTRVDLDVQRLIYAASGNRHLEEVLIRYHHLATRIWCLVIDRLPDFAQHVAEHARLLEAIAAGDADTSEQLLLVHIDNFEREIRKVL